MHNFPIKALNAKDYAHKWLSALSGFLPLTTKELDVLSDFLALYIETKDTDLFQTKNRAVVKRRLKMTTQSLNNYIASLKAKHAIFITHLDTGGTASGIAKVLIPEHDHNVIVAINISRDEK
jgi:hypothetical protein